MANEMWNGVEDPQRKGIKQYENMTEVREQPGDCKKLNAGLVAVHGKERVTLDISAMTILA